MAKKYYKEDDVDGFAIEFASSQPIGFTEIIDLSEIKKLHIERYDKCRKDGIEFCDNFRAGLYMSILDSTITTTEAFLAEAHLKGLREELEKGDWLTAQNTISTLALSGIYDQALKDDISAGIDAYVTENY